MLTHYFSNNKFIDSVLFVQSKKIGEQQTAKHNFFFPKKKKNVPSTMTTCLAC